MTVVYVDEKLCTGCGLCTDMCATGAIGIVDGVARVEQSQCVACEACLSACPTAAILSLREPASAEKLKPVQVPAPAPIPVRPVAPVLHSIDGTWPRLGAVLGFVGREVAPLIAMFLENLSRLSPIEGVTHNAIGIPGYRSCGWRGGGRRARRRRRGR